MRVWLVAGPVAAAALAALGLLVWRPPLTTAVDPGPVDFANLVRRPDGGDALICPRSLCLRARADLAPPVFTSSADAVARALVAYALRNGSIDRIKRKGAGDRYHLRFLQRSAPFRAPFYVDILVAPLSAGAATVAMYARSGSDHASEFAALRSWLAAAGG